MSPQQENSWDFGSGSAPGWGDSAEPGQPAAPTSGVPSARAYTTQRLRGDAPLPTAPSAAMSAVRRNLLLIAGAIFAAVGCALGLAGSSHQPVFAVAGWLAGSLGCMGCVAAFSFQDAKRRAEDWMLAAEPHSIGRLVVLALGLAVIVLNAWQFADWAAR
jgi:hypothetical protein